MGFLLTVIIPVYNNISVSNAIESVLKYKTDQVELIVIDGGSTDGTINRIMAFSDFIDGFISEKDEGMYDALNKGIKKAKGEWIFCLAADDILKCNLNKIIRKYAEAETDLICGNVIVEYTDNSFLPDFSKMNLELLDFRCTLRHPATLFRKCAYNKYGLYNKRFVCAGDRELFLRFRNKGAVFVFIPEYIVLFARGGLSSTNPIKWNFREDKQISDMYGINKMQSKFVYFYRVGNYLKSVIAQKTKLNKPINKLLYSAGLKRKPDYLTKLQVKRLFDEQESRLSCE